MADLKITQMDAVETPDGTDLLETVQDVATTPINKKITWTQIKAFFKTYFDTLYEPLGGGGGGTPRVVLSWTEMDPSSNYYDQAIISTGVIIVSDGAISIGTGTGDGAGAELHQPSIVDGGVTDWTWNDDPEIQVRALIVSNPVGSFISALLFGTDGNPDTSGNLTSEHIGFILDGTTLYASSSNGSTQEKTDISSGITLTNRNTYRAIVDSGNNVKFYINKVLVATHSTYIPSGARGDTEIWSMRIKNDTGNTSSKILYIGSITVLYNAE